MKKLLPVDKRQRSISQFFGAKVQNENQVDLALEDDKKPSEHVATQSLDTNKHEEPAEHANPIPSPPTTFPAPAPATAEPELKEEETKPTAPSASIPKPNAFDAFAFKSTSPRPPIPIFPRRPIPTTRKPAKKEKPKASAAADAPSPLNQLPSPSTSPPAPQPVPEPNAYELERLERIRRNMEVMKNMGLGAATTASLFDATSKNGLEGGKPPGRRGGGGGGQRKRPRSFEERAVVTGGPVRRSQRNVGGGGGGGGLTTISGDGDVDNAVQGKQRQVEEEELCYDDSSVHRYVCNVMAATTTATTTAAIAPSPPSSTNSAIQGFQRLPGILYDSALARTYSLDYHQPSGLVAAAGKDGRVAIWGTHAAVDTATPSLKMNDRDYDNGDDNDDNELEIEPLLSYKLHKGWISDVQLWQNASTSLSSDDGDDDGTATTNTNSNSMFLLSAGNDGIVCLWDITKTATKASLGLPQCLIKSEDLHGGCGVFSMHTAGQNRVLTGSKDCSVVLSTFDDNTLGKLPTTSHGSTKSSTFSVVQKYEDLHDGCVVKCVRWKPSYSTGSASESDAIVFASCGNDRAIRIVDTRVQQNSGSSSGSLVLEGEHSTAINHIRWSPISEYLLLSASHDPNLLLHDLRKSNTALFSYTGHSPPGKRITSIYQPVFVAGGTAIAAAGQLSLSNQLSLYSVVDGKTISRGEVDIGSIGATYCSGGGGGSVGAPLFCSSNRCVAMFTPQWKEAI